MSTVIINAVHKAASGKAAPRDSVREVLETVVFVVALVLMLKLFVVEAFVIPTGSMAETLLGYNKVVVCPECGFVFPLNATSEVEPSDGRPRPVTGGTCPNCRRPLYFPDAVAASVGQGGEAGDRERVAKAYKDLEAAGAVRADSADLRSGDRVLVHKALYSLRPPDRGDVVVFKFPVDPQIKHTAQNYIKRLWGLGGETIAVCGGDLYVARLDYPEDAVDSSGAWMYPRPEDPLRKWEGPQVLGHSKTDPPYQGLGGDFTYHNKDLGPAAFKASREAGFPGGPGRFELIRKTDAQALSMRRIVYDNEHQSKSLAGHGVPPRWAVADPGWTRDNDAMPKRFAHAGDRLGWVRYQHRLAGPPTPIDQQGPDDNAQWDAQGRQRVFLTDWQKADAGRPEGLFPPSLITNFLGYNAGVENGVEPRRTGNYWVGDLMVECSAKVSGPADEVVLELSKGVNRFQARFTNGAVTLVRTGPKGREMAARPTPLTRAGTYALRFANVDCRLRVWVDGSAVDFGADGDYAPADAAGFEDPFAAVAGAAVAGRPDVPQADGHTVQNDILAPASLGAKGAVEFGKIGLWEDTFFTPADPSGGPATLDTVDTFYVQPGHYFCLGDNSGQSSDGRVWGLVPERLMLGKAVFVFWPFSFSFNRIGFIR